MIETLRARTPHRGRTDVGKRPRVRVQAMVHGHAEELDARVERFLDQPVRLCPAASPVRC